MGACLLVIQMKTTNNNLHLSLFASLVSISLVIKNIIFLE